MLVTADDVTRCRALVAEIDVAARQTEAYESERLWTNPEGAHVYDANRPTGPDSVTAQLLAELPHRATFFTGWTGSSDSPKLGFFGRNLWRIIRVPSAAFGAKALALWIHGAADGPPLEVIDSLTTEYAHGLPAEYICGADFDGTALDRAATQERLQILYRSGLLERLRTQASSTILEIGAGYGALALAIKRVVPHASYIIVDLPHSLYLSGCYLATRQHEPVAVSSGRGRPEATGFQLVLSTMLSALDGLSIDLAINTLSFGEMSSTEVERYATFIRRNLAPRGSLFEQNFANAHRNSAHFCDPGPVLWEHFQRCDTVPGIYLKGRPRIWR